MTATTTSDLSDLLSTARPLDAAAVADLAASLAQATVVGIGESTRFARETFVVRDQLFRILVEQYGFRALAIQDSGDVAEELDRFVRGGTGAGAAALDNAWRPWRSVEMADALEWIRDFNRSHTADPVRVLTIKPAQAKPVDYDAVIAAVELQAPERVAELAAHLDPIRTAHTMDEHVQRARGTHPGRPFAEHATDAATLLDSVPGISDEVRAHMRLIVDFHEQSVAGRGSFTGDDELFARSVITQQSNSGLRIMIWDGIAHTSAAPMTFGSGDATPHPTLGTYLRAHYGPAYVSIAIGFHHANLGITDVPAPPADFVDAHLGTVDLPAHWIDLRPHAELAKPLSPAKLRVISGVYDPAHDADAHIKVDSLSAAFDAVLHFREPAPLTWLP